MLVEWRAPCSRFLTSCFGREVFVVAQEPICAYPISFRTSGRPISTPRLPIVNIGLEKPTPTQLRVAPGLKVERAGEQQHLQLAGCVRALVEFEVVRAQRDWEQVGGIYMFVKPHDGSQFGGPICLFIGKTDDFSQALARHDMWQAAENLGAREIHLITIKHDETRGRVMKDLMEAAMPDPQQIDAAPRRLGARRHRNRRKVRKHALDAQRVEFAQFGFEVSVLVHVVGRVRVTPAQVRR